MQDELITQGEEKKIVSWGVNVDTFMNQQHLVCPHQGAVSWPYAIQASTPTYQLAGAAVSQPSANNFCG